MEKETVVKCKRCDSYFGYTQGDPKCKFCHTEYGEVEEETRKIKVTTERKVPVKPQKESFKIWKDEK